ncbi:MAG: HEAT repeat domain-containing protein [Dehalococcoidia bacterium]
MRIVDLFRSEVGRLEAKRDVQGLIDFAATLGYASEKDHRARARVVKALGKIGNPAVGTLISLLEHEDLGVVRLMAVEALGEIGDATAVEPLLALSQRWRPGSSPRRAEIAQSLCRIGHPTGFDFIAQGLVGGWRDDRVVLDDDIVLALHKIGKPIVQHLLSAMIRKSYLFDQEMQSIAERYLEEVLRAVGWKASNDVEEISYLMATRQFDRLVRADAVEPLVWALKHGGQDVALRAADTLGEIGDAGAVEPLICAFEHIPMCDEDAARALAKLGDPSAIPALRRKAESLAEFIRSQGPLADTPSEAAGVHDAERRLRAIVEAIQKLSGEKRE